MTNSEIFNSVRIDPICTKHTAHTLEIINVILSKGKFSLNKKSLNSTFDYLAHSNYRTYNHRASIYLKNKRAKEATYGFLLNSAFQSIKQSTDEICTRLFIGDTVINKNAHLARDLCNLVQFFSENTESLDNNDDVLDNKILRAFPDIKNLEDLRKKVNLIFIRLMNLVGFRNLIVLIVFIIFNLKIGILLHIVNELIIEFYKNLINIMWYSKTSNDHYRKVN